MSMAFEMLRRHEGFRSLPYTCTAGKMTVGYGHNLNEPMSDELGAMILQYDIKVATRELIRIFQDFSLFGERRASALIDIMVNLGATRFRTFKKMIAAIKKKDWISAAQEAKDSKWYEQVGSRSSEIVNMLT